MRASCPGARTASSATASFLAASAFFQLGIRGEVIGDRFLALAEDEHHVSQPITGGLGDHELQGRRADDRQQLLGHRLRHRQESRTPPGRRDEGTACANGNHTGETIEVAHDKDGSAPSKAALRAQLLAARAARSDVDRTAARSAIAGWALERVLARSLGCVAAYVPLRNEPGSLELLDGLAAAGVRVLVPEVLPDLDLAWAEWSPPRSGVEGSLGDAELVFVPALAVDPAGNRLGRGGGSYDRALAPRTARDARSGAVVRR